MSSIKGRVRIICKSFDSTTLEKVVLDISKAFLRSGSKIKGPIRLPTKKTRYTVLRSPHIDKKSREHFEKTVHTRVINLVNYNPQTMSLLKNVELDSIVDIKIKS